MLQKNPPGWKPFGLGHEDVVLPKCCDHVAAQDAHQDHPLDHRDT